MLIFLNLNEEKYEFIKNRINALFPKDLIAKDYSNMLSLTEKAGDDINNRLKLYEIELASLTSAQIDLLTGQYGIPWTADESKKISIWIANSYILNQLENLREINATIVNKDFYNISENSINKLKDFLKNNKKLKNKCRTNETNDM